MIGDILLMRKMKKFLDEDEDNGIYLERTPDCMKLLQRKNYAWVITNYYSQPGDMPVEEKYTIKRYSIERIELKIILKAYRESIKEQIRK